MLPSTRPSTRVVPDRSLRAGPPTCARLFLIASLLLPASAFAQPVASQEAMPLRRLIVPITLDGRMDDPAWKDIPALPLTMHLPVFKGAPTQRTEIRVAYDDEHVYVGGWFYDGDPSGIRINSLYRDRWNGDDALAIYIDP